MGTPQKRQRVPRACDECKRKKKQCNGKHPCTACAGRSLTCIFSNTARSDGIQRNVRKAPEREFNPPEIPQSRVQENTRPPTAASLPRDYNPEDETPIERPGRLLRDNRGRVLYVGDSATLSFLQSIRILVASSLGPSLFTTDSSRNKILEATISIPHPYQQNFALPDLEAAQYLVNSFFSSTTGLFQIFNKSAFTTKVLETYSHPLDADPQWLCHLNLVFAIGLQLCRDITAPSPVETGILRRLEGVGVKRAETFYHNAKGLKDPVLAIDGGELADVQSLLLAAIYMLASSKRNSAWGYLGMGVNLAYALGFHTEEVLVLFNSVEKIERRNLWQSLYIMDSFLATSLGRPISISYAPALDHYASDEAAMTNNELLFAVKASKIIGDILSRVYHKRKASRSIAYALTLQLGDWMKELPEELDWRSISVSKDGQEMALKRLHINLIYFHGILLLMRPFLLHRIGKQLEKNMKTPSYSSEQQNIPLRIDTNRPEQSFSFQGACVRSAMHTINGVYAAYDGSALPRRDPFVIYWLFSAALVVLANIFCPVHIEPDGRAAVQKALAVMSYCGTSDPLARRYYNILEAFHDVLTVEADKKSKEQWVQEGHGNVFSVLFGVDDGRAETRNGVGENMQRRGTNMPLASCNTGIMTGEGTVAQPMNSNRMDFSHFTESDARDNARWAGDLPDIPDEVIDFDGAWRSFGQDSFVAADDMQFPFCR